MAEEKADTINVGGRDFEIKGLLGKGGFSTVLKAVDKDTKKKVALKLTFTDAYKNEIQKQVSMQQVHKEIKVMRVMQHPNIIRLLGYDLKSKYKERSCIVMVQELAPRRELFEYLMHSGTFSQELARTVFSQLCVGLETLHKKGITHRDLKPENVLFDSQFTLKIVDFGFATAFYKAGTARIVKTVLGTRGYMAPEIGNSEPYTEKVDVFASGVILFILMSGFPPFRETVEKDWWWNKILSGRVNLFWLAHERKAPQFKKDSQVKDLISKMIAVNPDDRPTISEVRKHPWMKGPRLEKENFQKIMRRRLDKVNRSRTSTAATKNVLAEHITNVKDGLQPGQIVPVAPIITNEVRQGFATATTVEEVDHALNTLSKFSNFFRGMVGQMKFTKNKLEASQKIGESVDVDDIMSVTDLESQQAAKFLKTISTIKLNYPNYDHSNTETWIGLDTIQPPPLAENFNELAAYNVRCGFGLLCVCMEFFADRKGGEIDINDEDCSVKVKVGFIETETLPADDYADSGKTQEVDFQTEMEIEARLYRSPNKENNVIVFNNVTEGANKYVTQNYYNDYLTELINETLINPCMC